MTMSKRLTLRIWTQLAGYVSSCCLWVCCTRALLVKWVDSFARARLPTFALAPPPARPPTFSSVRVSFFPRVHPLYLADASPQAHLSACFQSPVRARHFLAYTSGTKIPFLDYVAALLRLPLPLLPPPLLLPLLLLLPLPPPPPLLQQMLRLLQTRAQQEEEEEEEEEE